MPPKTHLVILALTLLLSPLIAALGVNCHGRDCKDFFNQYKREETVSLLNRSALEIPDTSTWKNGANIACVQGITGNLINGAICAWVWNTNNDTTGAQVKHLLPQIWNHGCKLCGSTPIVEDGSNDVEKGEVTVGFSRNEGGCDGACNEWGGSEFLPGALIPSVGDGSPPPATPPNRKRGMQFEG